MSSVPENFEYSKLSDPKYKGEDFNVRQDLLKEPFNNRKCTDVCMGFLFFLFLCGMLGMTIFGYSNGNIGELLAPIAAQPPNYICGYSPGTTDF
jgi:hypothetical protein